MSMLRNVTPNDLQDLQEDETIGQGSFATCSICRMKDDPNTPRVLKMIKGRVAADRGWVLSRLNKEVTAMHKVASNRSDFVKPFGLYLNQGLVGYIMEYCENGSLRILLRTLLHADHPNVYPWLTARWMRQVAEGFAYLQDNPEGVYVHRDLAPDNLLLTADLNIKIGDFGLAKSLFEQSVVTQNTQDFERVRGVERRLPETYDDPLRKPDEFGDRYLYGVCIVESFGALALRELLGNVEEFKNRVRSGEHKEMFWNLINEQCFERYPLQLRKSASDFAAWSHLRDCTREVTQRMLSLKPEDRPKFQFAVDKWRSCHPARQEEERQKALKVLERCRNSRHNASPQQQAIESEKGRVLTVESHRPESPAADRQDSAGAEMPAAGRQDSAGAEAGARPRESPAPRAGARPSPKAVYNIGMVQTVHRYERPMEIHKRDRPMGDEHLLMRRKFGDIVLNDELLRQLCFCPGVLSRRVPLVNALDASKVLEQQKALHEYHGPKEEDHLYRMLREMVQDKKLTSVELVDAFRKSACFEGLRLLMKFEPAGGN